MPWARFIVISHLGADFERSAYGIVFPKNWLYQQELDVAILSVRESGTFDALKMKWMQANVCARSTVVSTAMSLESMTGLFMTFGAISTLALLWFLWRHRLIIKDRLMALFHRRKSMPITDDALSKHSERHELSTYSSLYF